MKTDFEIGRVVAVDTSQVTIELSTDLKALTRTTYEGAQEIGRINSYVIVPVGARRLVAMITRVLLLEEAEMSAARTMITLPTARRLMKATLIGTIDGNVYTQGIAIFPVLDNPVHMATIDDLKIIFDTGEENKEVDPDNPGYCVYLGDSPIFEGFRINVDPDALFGKHLAILGSTGSGKSCTVASLIQSILERDGIRRTNIVILDTNGEYRAAFQKHVANGNWVDLPNIKCLYVPTDPKDTQNRLIIPYWFLNTDDFVRLFRASPGVQRPVLLEALRLARSEASARRASAALREELVLELNRIWTLSGSDAKTSKDVRDLSDGLLNRIDDDSLTETWQEMKELIPGISKESIKGSVEKVKELAGKQVDQGIYPKIIPADTRAAIREEIDPLITTLSKRKLVQAKQDKGISVDDPSFFDLGNFRSRHIEQVLRREESGGARARDYSGTMLLRIDRLLEDQRFDFLFGEENEMLPNAIHVLASFIRDILGMPSSDNPTPPLSNEEEVAPGDLPFYDRQRKGTSDHNIVIIDLSLLASEVLENVTALIGRLILEFLQRIGEQVDSVPRGSFPVVLVLEEAQNYVRDKRFDDKESISREVFERIAREGRKYGLGLVVASQRPSELSRTVLSQCNSFIVHRLQNPEDLRYFKEIVPSIYGPLMDQLPALAPQTALVIGECVRAPVLARIREAKPLPRSRDPKFFARWVADELPEIDVEGVCADWEGIGNDNTPQEKTASSLIS